MLYVIERLTHDVFLEMNSEIHITNSSNVLSNFAINVFDH